MSAWWLFAPAALFLAVWSSVSPALITNQVLTTEAAESLPEFGFERGAILSDARNVAQGRQAEVRMPAAAPLGKPYADASHTRSEESRGWDERVRPFRYRRSPYP